MEDRRKQKWQRCKKNNKAELNCLGMEPVQASNSRNGKKVSETEALPLCSHIRCDWRNLMVFIFFPMCPRKGSQSNVIGIFIILEALLSPEKHKILKT